MNKIWSIILVAILTGCSFNTEPKASAAAQAFAEAFCNWDSKYLSDHTVGKAHLPQELIESFKGALFDSCKDPEYFGQLKVNGDGLTRHAFSLYITDDQGPRQIILVLDFDKDMVYHFDYAD